VANLERFKTWLENELKERGWSYRELERQAGKNASDSKISLTLAGKRSITWDFCLAIAGPLGYTPEEVFKIAGLLPNGNGTEKGE
jgi:transcriptional regulator with XRE-family HTH domain